MTTTAYLIFLYSRTTFWAVQVGRGLKITVRHGPMWRGSMASRPPTRGSCTRAWSCPAGIRSFWCSFAVCSARGASSLPASQKRASSTICRSGYVAVCRIWTIFVPDPYPTYRSGYLNFFNFFLTINFFLFLEHFIHYLVLLKFRLCCFIHNFLVIYIF